MCAQGPVHRPMSLRILAQAWPNFLSTFSGLWSTKPTIGTAKRTKVMNEPASADGGLVRRASDEGVQQTGSQTARNLWTRANYNLWGYSECELA